MSLARIEHVNVTVTDPDRTAALLHRLFGWKERWRGPARDGGRVIHVGTEEDYIAVFTERPGALPEDAFQKGRPLNHIGVVVDDLDACEARVKAEGIAPFNHADYDPGRRFYFFDPDGIEYEVVSYD